MTGGAAPPSPRGEGRSARSGRGGGGGLECPGGGGRRPRGRSRAGGEGRGPGAGRGRGPPLLPAPGSVSPPSPRRLGVGGAVWAGGAARGGARCFVSSFPCGVARAAGEAPAPSGRRANGGGGGGESAALPGAKATPRSSQATRRAGKSAGSRGCGRERGGRDDKASLSRVPPPPSAPPPRACVVCSGVCGGFSGGCAGDTGRQSGRGAGAFGQRSGSGSRRKGKARCAPARGERGAGLRDEVTDPGGGDGPRAAGLAVFTSPRESPLPRSGLN